MKGPLSESSSRIIEVWGMNYVCNCKQIYAGFLTVFSIPTVIHTQRLHVFLFAENRMADDVLGIILIPFYYIYIP